MTNFLQFLKHEAAQIAEAAIALAFMLLAWAAAIAVAAVVV